MKSASLKWPIDAIETIWCNKKRQEHSTDRNKASQDIQYDHANDACQAKLVNIVGSIPLINIPSNCYPNGHNASPQRANLLSFSKLIDNDHSHFISAPSASEVAEVAPGKILPGQSIITTTCDLQHCDVREASEDMIKLGGNVSRSSSSSCCCCGSPSAECNLGLCSISSRLIGKNVLDPINPIRKVTSATLVTNCGHHRTKTKIKSLERQQNKSILDETTFKYNCTNYFLENIYHRFTTRTTRHTIVGKRHHDLTSWKIRWTLIQIALIYIILTSDSLNIAQASTGTTNYWPLIHQHRYQQLFFTGHTQQQQQQQQQQQIAEDGNGDHQQQQPQLQLHHHRRLINPSIRHQSTANSAAAVAAAAAAIAATANAAKARKSQSHNLMIGQNFNNFSSIIPYSIVQDVDYGVMPEDPLINEPSTDQTVSDGTVSLKNSYDSTSNNNLDDQLEDQAERAEFKTSDNIKNSEFEPLSLAPTSATQQQQQQQQQQLQQQFATAMTKMGNQHKVTASDRALLPLDSNRLALPQMQQIKARFNQGCVGGTKCQFFAFCWMSGGSLGASCGLLMTCCVTPSRQEIQPGFYGPVVNDPYCGRSTSKINRIVGGTDASFGQFPWQAFVQVGGSRCGGALISSRHVVTAGHCVARSQHSPSSIKVTLGDYILNSDIESIPHEVYSVVEVLLHPNFRFTPQADRYDVAVLELDRAASYKDNIKPICLPQKDATFVGRVAYVAGWGALQAGSKLRPKVLQHVAVPVIENNVCESWHRRKGIDIRIYDEMMCAGYELGQRDACQGDSGGPLMLNQFGVWYLVGIVSAGYSCAKQYQPGIYHRKTPPQTVDWYQKCQYYLDHTKSARLKLLSWLEASSSLAQ